MALGVGTRLGAYEITGELGVGGMGEVYRAIDTNLKREAAIKILPPAFASDADRIARFQREAEALAALNHPNIAQIYGLERSGETTALAMELIEGPTLADRIADGAIPSDEALHIAMQIADALEAAHERGIVHRDLKPANVKLRPDGTVKVLDFGIATAPESAIVTSGQRSPTRLTPALTEAGVLLGTAAYMSPEQARGRSVDRRTDIWAFGCVLYEMLTGQPAFGSEDVTTTLARVLERGLDAGSLPAGLSPTVSRTIELCLQKDIRERLSDIRDVKLALKGAFETRPPSNRRPAGRVALTAGAAIVAFLLGVAAVHWLPLGFGASSAGASTPTWASEPVRFAVYPPAGTTFGSTFAISRDGRQITFVARAANGRSQLWLQSLNGGDARPLPGTEAAEAPFWSPDGEWIGFFSGKMLKRVQASGGESAQTIAVVAAREQEILHGTWGADGVIVFQNNTAQGLLRVSVQDGSVSPATEFEGETAHLYPEFIGDTRDFFYDDGPDIKIGSLDGAPPRTLLTGWVIAGYLPRYVLYAEAARGLFARPFDEAALKFSGPAFRVLGDIPVAGTGQVPVSVSSNGVLVYRQQIDEPVQFRWIDRDGSVSEPLTSPGYYGGALGSWDLAPGNDRIAVRRSDKGGSGTLWLWDIARGNEQPITQNGDSLNPVFSPDGESLVFSSARGHPPDLFRKVFGQGEEQLLAGGPAAMFAESWDPSRNSIVYEEKEQQSGADLWSVSLDDMKTRPLPVNTNFDETDGQVSPSGHWIAYVSNASGENRIVLAGLPSGQPRCPVSVGGGVMPRWRADGRELYYVSADRRLMAVELTSSQTACSLSPPKALFSIPANAYEDASNMYEPKSDGQRFLFLTRVQDPRNAPLRVVLNWPALKEQ